MNDFLESLKLDYEAQIKKAEANIKIYMKNPAGIGEHPDIMGAIEEELAKAAEFDEKLKLLEEICREHG